jgi:hypothetical protein
MRSVMDKDRQRFAAWHRTRRCLFFLWFSLFLGTALVFHFRSTGFLASLSMTSPTKRNVIFMVSDGFGPASEVFPLFIGISFLFDGLIRLV